MPEIVEMEVRETGADAQGLKVGGVQVVGVDEGAETVGEEPLAR